MADKLVVREDALETAVAQLRRISHELSSASQELRWIPMDDEQADLLMEIRYKLGLSKRSKEADAAQAALRMVRSDLDTVSERASNLANRLRQVTDRFSETEASLGGGRVDVNNIRDGWMKLVTGWNSVLTQMMTELQAAFHDLSEQLNAQMDDGRYAEAARERVFDERGMYGGDQGSPYEDRLARMDEYNEIFERNLGRRLDAGEMQRYMARLNSEGCGYVAICNSIFCSYQGRPADFERDFGFPMFVDGDLNYNHLLVDLYSATDNITGGVEIRFEDYNPDVDGSRLQYNPLTDTSGSGITVRQQDNRAAAYLEAHGVPCQTRSFDCSNPANYLTAEKYRQLVSTGEVGEGELNILVGGRCVYLYDANGNVANSYDGGHFMTVTGTQGDMLRVSSWGEEYYINPAEIDMVDGFYEYSYIRVG